jgi:hypothetical protein
LPAGQVICDKCIVGSIVALDKPATMSFNLAFLVDDLGLGNFELVACDFDGEFAQMLSIFFEEASILCFKIKHKLLALISPSNETKLLLSVLVQLETILSLLLLIYTQP